VYRDRLFKTASWETWREAFSREAGEDLAWFFDQWVKKPGAPRLRLDAVDLAEEREATGTDASGNPVVERRWTVTGRLVQEGGPFRVRTPLVFQAGDRAESRTIEIAEATSEFKETLPFRPEILRADPEQDVFRRLDPAEVPPVLSLLLGDPRTLFVVDDAAGQEAAKAYREMAATMTRTGEGEVVDASAVTPKSLAGRSVFLLGLPKGDAFKSLVAALPKEVSAEAAGFSVQGTEYRQAGAAVLAVGRWPGDPAHGIAVFLGLSPDGIRAAGRKLVHYGKYSFLAFVDGTNKAKGVARADGGPLVLRFGG
jgi:hypothetical protein